MLCIEGVRLAVLALVLVTVSGHAVASAAPLPLGDGRVTTHGPRTGWVLACEAPVAGPRSARPPWIEQRTYDPALRPLVDGSVRWPGARFVLRSGNTSTAFAGNGEPVGTPSGVFPPVSGDDAASYASDAAALSPHALAGSFRRIPAAVRDPRCLTAGEPVAVATNGVPVLPAFTAAGLDAVAGEVVDRCGGATDSRGLYHYRAGLPCLLRGASGARHSPLVARARDGFGVYGPRGSHGGRLRSGDLDACHGHVHPGRGKRVYHYHLTADYPYAIGCFRGRPSGSWSAVPIPAPSPESGEPPSSAPPPIPEPEPDLAELEIAAAPQLGPSFDLDVSDYVTRCDGASPVDVAVDAPAHARVAVDGAEPREGSFTAAVDLDAGEGFAIEVRTPTTVRTYHVRCLPPDFPSWEAHRLGEPQAEWYVVTPVRHDYVAIFDSNGVPVWWMKPAPSPMDAKVLSNGNLVWARRLGVGFVISSAGAYEERRLDGSTVDTHRIVGSPTDFHDFERLPNGNQLMLSYRPRDGVDLSPYGGPADATVLDAVVQEVDPQGDVAWSWSSEGAIPLSDTEHWWPSVTANPTKLEDGRTAYDIVHINSVEPDGDGIVVSMRHTDAVYRIDRDTGAVDWKLGGTATPERLTILNDGFGDSAFGGQHDARVLGDGTVTLHDNGTGRDRGVRALRYSIDPLARTATLLEQITDSDPPFSGCCGGVRRLPGGNWVASWGASRFVTELTPAGEKAFQIVFSEGVYSYRAFPVPPGTVHRSALRAGMDAMNPR